MIVTDASAMVDVLLNERTAGPLMERLFTSAETLHAPHLLDLEVTQALRRHCLSGRLSAERGREALRVLAALPLTRYPHEGFLPRIWELRDNVTAYDAAYIALAESLSAPLVTRDRAFASFAGHRAKIEII